MVVKFIAVRVRLQHSLPTFHSLPLPLSCLLLSWSVALIDMIRCFVALGLNLNVVCCHPWFDSILNLQSNSITGVIPSYLGSLSLLAYLSFASNSMSGGIPASVTTLRQLRSVLVEC